MSNINLELDLAKNMFGTIQPDIRARILNFMDNPTISNWDDISSIIISWSTGTLSTIWQFVIEVDSTFPRTGKITDRKGNILKNWERIPTPKLVKKALIHATH